MFKGFHVITPCSCDFQIGYLLSILGQRAGQFAPHPPYLPRRYKTGSCATRLLRLGAASAGYFRSLYAVAAHYSISQGGWQVGSQASWRALGTLSELVGIDGFDIVHEMEYNSACKT